jgi:CRISPR/Cas system-associated protein endoribonuclease Cas2
MDENAKPSQEDIILNSKPEYLYNHDFGDGRFFQVVFEDKQETHIRVSARMLLKIIYIKDKDDIEGFEIIKLDAGKEISKLKLSKFNFQQLKCFLELINTIDLKGITDRRIALADDYLNISDDQTKKKIKTLLLGNDGSKMIYDLLKTGLITNEDLVNTGYRKEQLNLFEKLLYKKDGINEYKHQIEKSNTKDEIAWQYFFQKNPWMFGYGLDYKFQGILQREFHASDTNAAGQNAVISDFLLGSRKFTTFVELKLPTTEIFGTSKNRSNSWRLSSELIDAYSQILEQKASGQMKIQQTKELYDDRGNIITQHSYDSKTILIIGCWDQIKNDNEQTKKIKEKTFELFRRDSRNIEIITYDELYERVLFIVKGDKDNP